MAGPSAADDDGDRSDSGGSEGSYSRADSSSSRSQRSYDDVNDDDHGSASSGYGSRGSADDHSQSSPSERSPHRLRRSIPQRPDEDDGGIAGESGGSVGVSDSGSDHYRRRPSAGYVEEEASEGASRSSAALSYYSDSSSGRGDGDGDRSGGNDQSYSDDGCHDDDRSYDDDHDGSRSFYSDKESGGTSRGSAAVLDDAESGASDGGNGETDSRGTESWRSREVSHSDYGSGTASGDDEGSDYSHRSGSRDDGPSFNHSDVEEARNQPYVGSSEGYESGGSGSGSERSRSASPDRSRSSYDQSQDMLSLIPEEDSRADHSVATVRTHSTTLGGHIEGGRRQQRACTSVADGSHLSGLSPMQKSHLYGGSVGDHVSQMSSLDDDDERSHGSRSLHSRSPDRRHRSRSPGSRHLNEPERLRVLDKDIVPEPHNDATIDSKASGTVDEKETIESLGKHGRSTNETHRHVTHQTFAEAQNSIGMNGSLPHREKMLLVDESDESISLSNLGNSEFPSLYGRGPFSSEGVRDIRKETSDSKRKASETVLQETRSFNSKNSMSHSFEASTLSDGRSSRSGSGSGSPSFSDRSQTHLPLNRDGLSGLLSNEDDPQVYAWANDEGDDDQEETRSSGDNETENSSNNGDEEDSFFEKSLIAREPDMLPKITEHSTTEKSDYDESEGIGSGYASMNGERSAENQKGYGAADTNADQTEEATIRSLKSMILPASKTSYKSVDDVASVHKSAASLSVFSGASGSQNTDTVDVSIVSGKSVGSSIKTGRGRMIAQRKGYSREQMKKLIEERRADSQGESGEPLDRMIKGNVNSRFQMKSHALLDLVADVSSAMEEIESSDAEAEKIELEEESSARELLLGFEALVSMILQFSDELELMSTFARKKDASSIEALQNILDFAPVIDDIFVELKPILQDSLEDDIDEEMNDLLYGMNLTVDLLCEVTSFVEERQEWNIRANTTYVTLLELLSRDALEVACIFDDIDTPEYELTEQIEEAWAKTGHEEEFKTMQITTDLSVFRQICYDVLLSMDSWCPDIDVLMDICGIDDMILENETVEDHPDDRMFETPETALQVLEKINGEVLPRTLIMSRVMRRIMPTDFITDQKLREHIHTLKGAMKDKLGLPVSNLIAISSVPELLNEPTSLGIAGVGKTTMAAMVANHPDTRKFFNDGIAWIHIGDKEMTYTRYIQCLRELMAQIDIGDDEEPLFPELLHVPCETQAKRRRREEGFMMYAREIMVDFLQFRNVLIILDNICYEPDLDWFDFDPASLQTEETDDEFSCVILVTTRCRNLLPAADTIEIDLLDEKESIALLTQESGDLALSLSASSQTKSVVKECAYHPLAVKSVGRWLNLKHATAGTSSNPNEMHQEIINSMDMILKSANQEDADMMYEILNMSLSPAINGRPTNIIKFCFAAFVLVFCDKNQISDFALADATPIVPLAIAEILFESLLESEEQTLLQEGNFFYAQKKEAAVLIPEALSALGVLKVIITFTASELTNQDGKAEEIEEKYLQMMHAVQEEYGEYLYQEDNTLAELTKNAKERWNRAFGLKYLSTEPDWSVANPDAGVDYAFEMMPTHLILGGLFNEAAELLTHDAFVKGRLFALGRENGTRRHIKDCEALFDQMMENHVSGKRRLDPKATMKNAYEVLGSLINMDEDEYITQEGSTEALEVARAHSEIAFSLAEKRCWEPAITYWETSQELLVQSLGVVELVAAIQLNIGVLYSEMNEYEKALNAMRQCLRIRGAIHNEKHILYAQTIQKIGDIFLKMSDYHEAMESYNWALDTLHDEPTHHRIDIGDVLENIGNIHYSKGEIEEALQCYQDALRSKEIDLGEDHPELATTFQCIGNCLSDQGKTEEAIAHYEEAIRLKQLDSEMGGEREADILTMQGVLHNLNGRQKQALECYEKALQVLVTKASHKKEKIASLLHLIGCVYLMRGEHKKSMKLFEECLHARRKVLGFVHLDVASTLFNMAFLHQSRNRFEKALKCLEEALKIRQLRLPDSEKVAVTHEKIGTLARSIGKTKKADIAFNEALKIRKLIHGEVHEAVANVLQELGDLMDDLGEYDEAMKHYVEALDIRQTVLGPDDLAVAETLYSMGFSLQNNGATGRALQCFEESLSIRKFQLGDDAQQVGDTLNMMGFLRAQRGELDQALTLLWEALRVRKLQADHMKVSETLKNIGNVHREMEEYDEAIECYEECLRIRRVTVGNNHEKVADVYIAIGNVQSDLDLVNDAMRSYEEALRIRTMIHGEQDETVAAILQYMGTLEFRAEQLDRALQLLNEFIRIREEIGTMTDGDHVNVLFMIGNIHKLKGDDFEAQRYWTEAYRVFKELGLADPEVAAVMEQLVRESESQQVPTADSEFNRNRENGDNGLFKKFGKLTQKVKRIKKGKGQQL